MPLRIAKVSESQNGGYEPGCIYGTAKIYKNASDPPSPLLLRRIISQVTSPTYEIAKKLNNVIF